MVGSTQSTIIIVRIWIISFIFADIADNCLKSRIKVVLACNCLHVLPLKLSKNVWISGSQFFLQHIVIVITHFYKFSNGLAMQFTPSEVAYIMSNVEQTFHTSS